MHAGNFYLGYLWRRWHPRSANEWSTKCRSGLDTCQWSVNWSQTTRTERANWFMQNCFELADEETGRSWRQKLTFRNLVIWLFLLAAAGSNFVSCAVKREWHSSFSWSYHFQTVARCLKWQPHAHQSDIIRQTKKTIARFAQSTDLLGDLDHSRGHQSKPNDAVHWLGDRKRDTSSTRGRPTDQ